MTHVAVIMSNYNNGAYLHEAFQSIIDAMVFSELRDQGKLKVSVFFGDDGSNYDNKKDLRTWWRTMDMPSWRAIQAIEAEYGGKNSIFENFVIHSYQENRGNNAVLRTLGEEIRQRNKEYDRTDPENKMKYIVNLDSDDILLFGGDPRFPWNHNYFDTHIRTIEAARIENPNIIATYNDSAMIGPDSKLILRPETGNPRGVISRPFNRDALMGANGQPVSYIPAHMMTEINAYLSVLHELKDVESGTKWHKNNALFRQRNPSGEYWEALYLGFDGNGKRRNIVTNGYRMHDGNISGIGSEVLSGASTERMGRAAGHYDGYNGAIQLEGWSPEEVWSRTTYIVEPV